MKKALPEKIKYDLPLKGFDNDQSQSFKEQVSHVFLSKLHVLLWKPEKIWAFTRKKY